MARPVLLPLTPLLMARITGTFGLVLSSSFEKPDHKNIQLFLEVVPNLGGIFTISSKRMD